MNRHSKTVVSLSLIAACVLIVAGGYTAGKDGGPTGDTARMARGDAAGATSTASAPWLPQRANTARSSKVVMNDAELQPAAGHPAARPRGGS